LRRPSEPAALTVQVGCSTNMDGKPTYQALKRLRPKSTCDIVTLVHRFVYHAVLRRRRTSKGVQWSDRAYRSDEPQIRNKCRWSHDVSEASAVCMENRIPFRPPVLHRYSQPAVFSCRAKQSSTRRAVRHLDVALVSRNTGCTVVSGPQVVCVKRSAKLQLLCL